MATIDTFKEMSGIHQTSKLEITPKRAEAVISEVSAALTQDEQTANLPVTPLPVATYVHDAKSDGRFAYVSAKQPPFAAHWGILIGDLHKREAFLFHLVLDDDTGKRQVSFAATGVRHNSKSIVGADVTPVGHTKYPPNVLKRIGEDMIDAFGNYHLVFWNCQMFAKCFLRVITGDDAAFTQWTSADLTNLFLCALVIPMPISSSSKLTENRKMKKLQNVGLESADLATIGRIAEERELTEEELFKASDAVIDLMKASWSDDETLKKLSRPMKDSSDKVGLIRAIKDIMLKALGISS